MPDSFTDLQIQHAIYLLKYGNGLDAQIQKLLSDLERKTIDRIGARLASIDERGHDLGPATTKRLNQTLDEIRALNTSVYGQGERQLRKNLKDFAASEMEYTSQALKKGTGKQARAAIASPERLNSIVSQRPIKGKLLKGWFDDAKAGTDTAVEAVIREGMADGSSIDDMVRQIKGTKANGYRDGIWQARRSKIRTTVRTSVNHVSNHAQMESFAKNPNVVKGWEFLSTLDSNTTLICASNDGKVFKIGEGPIPPLHPNCRSTITAVTDEVPDLSGERASVDGPVKDQNFDKWLKNQSQDRQEAILGKTRANLWRDGKYKLQDFVRNNREVITLDELRGTFPEAVSIAANVAPAPPPPPTSAFEPINRAVTSETITVEKRLEIQKELRTKFEKAHQRHSFQRAEFKGSKGKLGNASFSTAFTDETVSMIKAILPEIDAITDRFKLPRLRGITSLSGGKASANMGDAVMGINADIFNGYAAKVGKGSAVRLAALRDEVADLRKRSKTTGDKFRSIHEKMNDAIRTGDESIIIKLAPERHKLAKEWEGLRKKIIKSEKQLFIAERVESRPLATWRLGDPVKDRPHGAKAYFSDMDQARNVMYHETAHLLHQEYKRKGYRRDVGSPPLEVEIQQLYSAKQRANRNAFFERLPSRYAGTNSKEWFAESFSLYMMGRKDLVDEDLIKLIERLLDEASD